MSGHCESQRVDDSFKGIFLFVLNFDIHSFAIFYIREKGLDCRRAALAVGWGQRLKLARVKSIPRNVSVMLDNWWESAWHWAYGQDNDQEWGHMMIQPIVKWRWAPWLPSSESSLGPAAEAWGLTLSPDHPTSQVWDQVNVFVNSSQPRKREKSLLILKTMYIA